MAATVCYIPWSLKLSNDVKTTIIAILTSAAMATPITSPESPSTTSNPQTNHWCLLCQLSDTEFVCVDPSPTGPNSSLQLLISTTADLSTKTSAKTCSLTTQNLTVESLLDRIKSTSYDKYQFTPGGQGCRYWVSCLIELLTKQGCLIDQNEVRAATGALKYVWGGGGAILPAEVQSSICEGRFYGC